MNLEVVNAFVDGGQLVILHREGDELKEIRRTPEYSFFVKTNELPSELARSLRNSRGVRAMTEEGEFTRIVWGDQWIRRDMLWGKRDGERRIQSPIQALNVDTFEGDVDPVRRFFTDTGARVAAPRRGFFDLETDSRVKFSEKTRARVLSWALTDANGEKLWSAVLREFSDTAERDLLEEFFDRAKAFDQLLAWSGDGFDFPVLKGGRKEGPGRIDRLGLNVDPRRWLWLDHLKLFKKMNTAAESGEEKTSLKLNAVAFALLGEGKDEFDASKTYEEWEAGGERRARLLRYNEQDTRLLPKIEAKTGSAALFDVLADVCRVLPDSRGLAPTQQMDGFMLRLAMERGFHFSTKEWADDGGEGGEEDQFRGAYVLHPRTVENSKGEHGERWTREQAAEWRAANGMKNGIARNVHVADFASLYPSIILTWNMSPDTKVKNAPINGPIPPGTCRSPSTGISFYTDRIGVLPAALDTMIRLRKEWNDRKAKCAPGTPEFNEADRRSTAYKVAANSFYGVLGNKYSRFYDREIAESVTQNGVWLIKRTIAEAEARGMAVVYGDTDSFFAVNATQTDFEQFVKWCNEELYPMTLKGVGCRVEWGRIKLAYEKAFDRIVFVSAKRYAGRYLHYKGTAAKKDSKPEIRGLEYRRGDASKLARRLQERAILQLMTGDDRLESYREMVNSVLAHVQTDDLPLDEVVISKSLSKNPEDYGGKMKKDGGAAAVPPHVAVALAENAKGGSYREGDRVPYYVVDGADGIKAQLAERYQNDADRYYLWESLVYPPTMRVLESAFPDEDWSKGLEKIRPPKPRAKRGKVAPAEQGSLFALKVDPIAAATRVVLPENLTRQTAEDLVAVFVKRPGPMNVTVVLRLPNGAEAVIATNVKTKSEVVAYAQERIRHLEAERERIVFNVEADPWRV
jgi:DNA polymerase elongation subunit (family B)